MARSFPEHIAHMESARSWKVGNRVRVTISGRTGTIVELHRRHNGFMVKWDEPIFGVEQGRVTADKLELIQD